jgi:hypothetical protein
VALEVGIRNDRRPPGFGRLRQSRTLSGLVVIELKKPGAWEMTNDE